MPPKQKTPQPLSLFGAEWGAVDPNKPLYSHRRTVLESGSESWCSSSEVLDPIRQFSPIGFDPFSNEHSLVGATRSIALPENSLLIDWPTDILTYANPPYGDLLAECARKIAEQAERGCEIITLVPARVDARWWQLYLKPPFWCAWAGRLTFLETVVALEARYEERVEKAKAAGLKIPPKPKYKMVGQHLAEGETATFPSALCYHGPRALEFANHFCRYGKIYHELAITYSPRVTPENGET